MGAVTTDVIYLVASVLFILGIRGLTHPRTAVRGNMLGAAGMFLAVVATLLDNQVFGSDAFGFGVIIAGVVLGAAIGATLAVKIQMTAMPEMVTLLNAFGGGASALVAGAVLVGTEPTAQATIAIVASGIIGSVTFMGSLVAFDKLLGLLLPDAPVTFFGQQPLNFLLGLVALGFGAWLVADPSMTTAYVGVVAVGSVLGVLLTISIGGADMPVAIALLNSYSGLAAAATGFVLSNDILIITGSLVGASGIILTRIMCKAMNRSLVNIPRRSHRRDGYEDGGCRRPVRGTDQAHVCRGSGDVARHRKAGRVRARLRTGGLSSAASAAGSRDGA